MPYPGLPLESQDSFRILHLQPGELDDEIRFQLEIVALPAGTSMPDYEALSYTWGDPNVQENIFCSSSPTGSIAPLSVTVNCYHALRDLRYTDKPRTLWIDAICIDQTNIEERNAQVQMMGSIYAAARRVVVYLGESADDSDEAMTWYENEFDVKNHPEKEITISRPSWQAREALAMRPWFTRTWVLQEVANARSVEIQCGTISIPWEAFFYFCGEARKVHNMLCIVQANRKATEIDPRAMLLELLKVTRTCQSSDPRDKVYGILPLIPQELIPPSLRPNYKISIVDLLIRVATWLYPYAGTSLLSEISESQTAELPSWVPDWTDPYKRPRGSPRATIAGGDALDVILRTDDLVYRRGNHLYLKSIALGALTRIGSFMKRRRPDLIESWSMAQHGHVLSDIGWSQSEEFATIAHDYAELVTWGRFPSEQEIIWETLTKRFQFEHKMKYEPPQDSESSERPRTSELEIYWSIMDSCRERKFALIEPNRMALVPPTAQVSDVVHVLPGAPEPFVLRKQGDGYILIGRCYVQGIMDGEAMRGVDISSLETTILV